MPFGDISDLVASTYGIGTERVAVVRDVTDLPPREADAVGVEVEVREGGEFRTDLTIYNAPNGVSEREAAMKMATSSARRCLIDDGDGNPYSRCLISVDGSISSVKLDGDVLDEEEAFSLAA